MMELPEAQVVAAQIDTNLQGKQVSAVTAAASPHKFAWYYGDPQEYPARLLGKTIGPSCSFGGFIETAVEDVRLLLGEGAVLRLCQPGEKRPAKHHLLIEFADGTALIGTVKLYGGFWCFPKGAFDSHYYLGAKEKPSPLSKEFDKRYFGGMIENPETQKLCAKAFLATEQRIPGLGNGVLQDILFAAKIHPRRKISTLTQDERGALLAAIKTTLASMAAQGGRDTEPDLFGNPGGYQTQLSKNTAGRPCTECGSTIRKEAFMGGSIYFCPGCQAV